MTRIGLNKALEHLMSLHPSYRACYHYYQESDFYGEKCLPISIWGDFPAVLVEQFRKNDSHTVETIIAYIEELLTRGTQKTQDIVATIFLEELVKIGDKDPIGLYALLAQLGPEAKDYCRHWDQMTGSRTFGIYDV